MLDKCYIRGLRSQYKECSKRIERSLFNLKDTNWHCGHQWYINNVNEENIMNNIEDLKLIVDAQQKLIETLINDRIKEER